MELFRKKFFCFYEGEGKRVNFGSFFLYRENLVQMRGSKAYSGEFEIALIWVKVMCLAGVL